MKKVVFGITGLTLGGAERVLVDIANAICREYDVTIFTIYGNGELESQLDPNIKRVTMVNKRRDELNFVHKKYMSLFFRFSFFRRKIYQRYISEKYDVEVAFLEGPITWLFASPGKSRKLVWVHNDIKKVFGNNWKAKEKKKMSAGMYEKYDEIIFVSMDNQMSFEELYPNNTTLKRVIYNYLDEEAVRKKASEPITDMKHDMPVFVQVSRLTEQKGIDRLIDVHARLIGEGHLHHIYIIGTGPLEKELKEKIHTCHVEETFHLLGKKSNPYPYIKAADYFILTSLYEGYGMVIDEAKILERFVMITDTAAREAVADYPKSLVVSNDADGIYHGLKQLMEKKNQKIENKKVQEWDILGDIKSVLEGKYDNSRSNRNL